MKNVILDGTPILMTSLSNWAYSNGRLGDDVISSIRYYNIGVNGYLKQSPVVKLSSNSSYDVIFSYRLKNAISLLECKVILKVLYSDDSVDTILIPLVPEGILSNANWITYKSTFTVDNEKSVRGFELEFSNNGVTTELHTTEIGIFYDDSIATNDQYNPNEFQDNVILYGLDADKPRLRWCDWN